MRFVVTTVLASAFAGMFLAAGSVCLAYLATELILEPTYDEQLVMRTLPGPFGAWGNAWLWFAGVIAVYALPSMTVQVWRQEHTASADARRDPSGRVPRRVVAGAGGIRSSLVSDELLTLTSSWPGTTLDGDPGVMSGTLTLSQTDDGGFLLNLAVGPHRAGPESSDHLEFPLSADQARALRAELRERSAG